MSHSTIKSPKPRWAETLLNGIGLSHSNTPSPSPEIDSVKQNSSIVSSIAHFPSVPSHRFNTTPVSPSRFNMVVERNWLSDKQQYQQHNMSPFSEISIEEHKPDIKSDIKSEETDVQTIQFDNDIMSLQDVKLCDTTMFTPNIQYGKVVRVLSGSELLVAARIYNGYTKVLFPKLYCFRIRLRDVSFFGIHEDAATEELERLILDKIVLLTNITTSNDGFNDAKVYLLHISNLKNYLKYGRMMNIANDDGNLYVNETINNYIKYRLK